MMQVKKDYTGVKGRPSSQPLTGHAEFLGLLSVKATLGTRQLLTVIILDSLSPDVLLAVTGLAAQAGVLAMAITRLTCQSKEDC